MPTLFASHVRTGAQLRRFVLELLRERRPHPPLDHYLASLWRAAQDYCARPFTFQSVAELLQAAFDAPPMSHDWDAALAQPYRWRPDHLAPPNTPEYYAEASTYELFERTVVRQIEELKRLQRQPPMLNPLDFQYIEGARVWWENTDVEGFLERATATLEESEEEETDTNWGWLTGILRDGQYTE